MTTEYKTSDTAEIIAIAARVIDAEVLGLKKLAHSLDSKFVEAVSLISQISGRVVISGMGKSGHIARKIASTLSSTGTAALFVHPGEASHGDMGMITKKDVVILLSNSGETHEIKDIVTYCKRYAIPLIALVSNGESTLAESADITLVLPDVPEASEVSAPTTSTTMMLALGDALAIVLLESKGFNREDFQALHPGGKLGSIFIKVKDVMHKDDAIPLVLQDSLMSEVLLVMTAKRLGCVGLVDEQGKLAGIITDGDLRRHMSPELLAWPANKIMTINPKTIRANSLVAEALNIMNERSITSLFIVEDRVPIGVIHIHDCLKIGTR